MIPVSTLYDEYIERRKFTEQKKPSRVYSSSPLKRVGTMKANSAIVVGAIRFQTLMGNEIIGYVKLCFNREPMKLLVNANTSQDKITNVLQ